MSSYAGRYRRRSTGYPYRSRSSSSSRLNRRATNNLRAAFQQRGKYRGNWNSYKKKKYTYKYKYSKSKSGCNC